LDRPKIKLLDQRSINQIAAGEVVERPLSVVKELVENSLDASASKIEIAVEKGGTSLIKVKDNGIGIPAEDLRLAILPHATSKINSIDDLNNLQTLGFRGEALSSIASVSRLSILSRTPEQISGYKIELEGGKVTNLTEEACPIGTIVNVRDLFFNTPARKKFLRSTSTEFNLIVNIVSRIALARPDVAFSLKHNNRVVFQTSGRGNLLDTIAETNTITVAKKMIPIIFEEGDIKLEGFISPPDLIKSRNDAVFIVNGRVIRSQLLNKALKEGYHTFIPASLYPVAVLSLRMPPSEYDVNVHPSKLEIKFHKEQEIYKIIVKNVQNTLLNNISRRKFSLSDVSEKLNDNNEQTIKSKYTINQKDKQAKQLDFSDVNKAQNLYVSEQLNYDYGTVPNIKTEVHFERLRALGQIFNTYILCTDDINLYCIDQHAAHERIRYNHLLSQLKHDTLPSQTLLIPEIIEVNAQEEQVLLNHLQELQELGFTIEYFGERTYFLRSMPFLGNRERPGDLFKVFLDKVLEDPFPPTQEKLLEKWIFTLACHSSIRGNEKLSIQEMDELIQALGKTHNPYSCPHGRPVIIELPKSEFDRKFRRTI